MFLSVSRNQCLFLTLLCFDSLEEEMDEFLNHAGEFWELNYTYTVGLENMQAEQYQMAFSCFKVAADQNYSKAQYNVGLCYEYGRGTTKDMTKAILYYQRAAHQGHLLAQYRYVKWLFCCWCKAAMQNQNELPLKEKICLSSPCLQSLGQPLSAHLGQPAVGLLRSWSIGHLEDMADNRELQSYLMKSPSNYSLSPAVQK